jgi:hypothetical protein
MVIRLFLVSYYIYGKGRISATLTPDRFQTSYTLDFEDLKVRIRWSSLIHEQNPVLSAIEMPQRLPPVHFYSQRRVATM